MPNIMEVSVVGETTPSATSTPISHNVNLNSKKASSEVLHETSNDTLDLVVNKNFINAAVTGNRYWTNQALQNDNSLKINQVDSNVRKNKNSDKNFLGWSWKLGLKTLRIIRCLVRLFW